MALDIGFDLDDYIPDAPAVDRGQYVVSVRDCRELENGRLMIATKIVKGPVQKNGKDPAERDYTFFINLHPEGIDNEWARNHNMNLTKKVFMACGLTSQADATDFVGKTFWVSTAPRANKETGEIRDDPQDFRPYVEA